MNAQVAEGAHLAVESDHHEGLIEQGCGQWFVVAQ